MPDGLRRELRREVSKQTLMLEALVKRKLSNDVLRVRTGNLRASIHSVVDEGPTSITGKVASSGDVKYAAIHEFGGTIKHPGGTPFMSFEGQTFFVSKQKAANLNLPVTRPHDIPIPERSFMRSSLAERRAAIIEGLTNAAKRGAARP